jgi:hypothetical protein
MNVLAKNGLLGNPYIYFTILALNFWDMMSKTMKFEEGKKISSKLNKVVRGITMIVVTIGEMKTKAMGQARDMNPM